MAPFGVHITKQVTWRGQLEEFENVYHYDTSSPISTDAGWSDLIDQIVAAEKPRFGAVVSWKQARVHGPTNTTQAEDVMVYVKDLSGSGTIAGAGAAMPYESTIVAQFYLGRSARGYKRFLRKYYHTCKLASTASGSGVELGNAQLSAADKQPYIDLLNALKTLVVGGSNNDLCSPSGTHLPLGSSPTVLNYTHVRQFRR